jgi:hypothetical protein
MEEEDKKSDAEVLFPEQEVYGVKIRPWTFPQFQKVMPDLIMMAKAFKNLGIRIEDLPEKREDMEFEKILMLLEKIIPILPVCEIVAKTTGIDRETVVLWEFDKTTVLFLMIIVQNVRRIKNLSGLGKDVSLMVRKTV